MHRIEINYENITILSTSEADLDVEAALDPPLNIYNEHMSQL